MVRATLDGATQRRKGLSRLSSMKGESSVDRTYRSALGSVEESAETVAENTFFKT